jgi:hypothetical protein
MVVPAAARGSDPRAPAAPGDAPPLSIGFEWERRAGAESCPDGRAVQRATEKVVERHPFVDPDQASVLIRGTIAPTDDARAFEARIFLVAGDGTVVGERKLRSDGPNCAAFGEPLALVIGLAVDTLRQMPRTSLRIRKETPKADVWTGELSPMAVAAWGLLPSPGIGFGIDASAGPSSVSIDATAAWFLPSDEQTPGGPGGEFRAFAWSVSACPLLAGSVAELRVCAGAVGARLAASGLALDVSRSQTSWLWGAGARTMVVLHLGKSVALAPAFNIVAPFVRDRFTYTDEMQQARLLHRPSPILLTLQFGISIRIF